jgi:acyl-coenzyme A thioesterase PaaI-like protein
VKRRIGVATREELLAEDGLSSLPSMIESRHPISPYADTMDIHLVEAEQGRVVFNGRPSARFTNPLGVIQGGWAATILDAAVALVVHTTLIGGVRAPWTVEAPKRRTAPSHPHTA